VNLVEVLGFVVMLCLAYLAGSVPFGLIVGKVFYGVDVRQHGSGNVGTTNVFRVLGKKAGVVVMVLDILKGYVPALLAVLVFHPHPWAVIFIAAAPVVGHMYSVFLKGSGGKGVATGAGVVLALYPLAFLICFTSWLLIIVVTRYVSLASLTVAFLVPVLVILHHDPLPYEIAGVLVAVIVWWAHRGNIRRLAKGTENRVSLPWSGKHSAVPGSGGGH
jgi:acyl phosphate:glycerol-3-phosphate acyltransferase